MDKEFVAKAATYWSQERLDKLTMGKKLLVLPKNAAHLLKTMGLLNKDASISHDGMRKLNQINHMLNFMLSLLDDLTQRQKIVRILDAGCGNSYLSFTIAWYLKEVLHKEFHILGIDLNEKVIASSKEKAKILGFEANMRFVQKNLQDLEWDKEYKQLFGSIDVCANGAFEKTRPHLMIALHACDTATDHALAKAIGSKVDHFAVAPCCQAQLAQKWKQLSLTDHFFNIVFRTPHLRRETAAHITDAMRMLLARAHGYEVTASEFVGVEHSPKNRLLLGHRRGNFLPGAQAEYEALKTQLGDCGILLADLIGQSS